MIRQVIKDWMTEKDGQSFCPVRIGFFVVMAVYTGGLMHDFFTIMHYVFSEHAKDIAGGYADIIGAGGLAIAGKNYTEAP